MDVEVMYPNTLEMEDVQITETMKEYSMQSRLLNVGKVKYDIIIWVKIWITDVWITDVWITDVWITDFPLYLT